MNLFIYLMIICCTTYIGFGIAAYYVKREAFYRELVRFCERLKGDIGFLLLPVGEIFRGAREEFSSPIVEIMDSSICILNEGKPLSEGELLRRWRAIFLSAEEKQTVCRFFSMLGRSDEKTQIESIENYCRRFMQAESESAGEKKRYCPMYRKLGFLAGLAICLFML